jgi:hypothetical protein
MPAIGFGDGALDNSMPPAALAIPRILQFEINGFAGEVLRQLPMEFAVEAQKLLGTSLEGSVG